MGNLKCHFQPCVVLENVCLACHIQNKTHNTNMCKKKQTIVIKEASKMNSYIVLNMVHQEFHHPISLDID